MCSLLNSENDEDKIKIYLRECARMHIPILYPDINKSRAEFSIENTAIRTGLRSIKNVGEKAAQAIVELAPYQDVESFREKTRKYVDKRAIESLEKIGCLRSLNKVEQLSLF
jgi:DNA polymerase-3 subunit alpha